MQHRDTFPWATTPEGAKFVVLCGANLQNCAAAVASFYDGCLRGYDIRTDELFPIKHLLMWMPMPEGDVSCPDLLPRESA